MRVGLHGEIHAAARRPQVSGRRGRPKAVARGELQVARAFLRGSVQVVVAGDAQLATSRDERVRQLMALHVRYADGSVASVVCVGSARVRLRADEIGKHVRRAPARIAERAPMLEVLRLPARVDHPVDRARAAQRASLRQVDAPAVHVRLGVGGELPREPRVSHRLPVSDGDVDPGIAVLRPGFQEQHRGLAVGGKAVREHAPGRAGADDDVVEAACAHVWLSGG